MVKRPTVADLAEAAGVSVATIDRVLNGRLPVREDTAQKVFQAATAIGFHAAGVIRHRMRQELPEYRFGFLLLNPHTYYYQQFTQHIETIAATSPGFRCVCSFDYWAGEETEDGVRRLKALGEKCHAIAVVSHDHPSVTTAVSDLKARGIPTFSLLSDFALGVRQTYYGINDRKAGRTAAWMISNTAKRPGKVAVFVSSPKFYGHETREMGLRSYFREHAPEFTVLETLVNYETGEMTYEAMKKLLATYPDLVGCYLAGSGFEGAIKALKESNLEHLPSVVCSEINPEGAAALADRILTMIIATPLQQLSRDLLERMAQAVDKGGAMPLDQQLFPFDIYLPENV